MKRIMAILCIFAITLSIAGCTQKNQASDPVTTKPSTSETTADPVKNEKPYDGSVIRMVSVTGVFTDAVQEHLNEFTERTGISVNMELYAEAQLNQKLTTEFLAGNSSVDVYAISPTQNMSAYGKNGWAEPLNSYLDDPELDWNDFVVDTTRCKIPDTDNLGCLPILSNVQLMFYRKDIFEKHNLKPPTNYDELIEVCETLNDPDNGFYAIALRGEKNALTSQFSPFLYAFGGRWITDGVCTFDNNEAYEAVKFYGKLLGKYGPPSVLSAGYAQMTQIFNSGQVAMVMDADALHSTLTDPDDSNYYDKVGVAPIPAGPQGIKSYCVPAWAIAMYSGSDNKDASWEVIKHVMDIEVAVDNTLRGMPSYRQSIWQHERIAKEMPSDMAKAYEVTLAASEVSLDSLPILTATTEARDYIGVAIVRSIEKAGESDDILPLMQDAAFKINELLKSAGEYGEDYPF